MAKITLHKNFLIKIYFKIISKGRKLNIKLKKIVYKINHNL